MSQRLQAFTRAVMADDRAVPRRGAGFTVVELVIYATVLVIITAPMASVVMVSIRSTRENDTLTRVAERNRVAVSRVAEEIRPSIRDSLTISNQNRQLDLTLPDSFNGTSVVPGKQIRFALEIGQDEKTNGKDDNGNGLIDEGQLVRYDLATGERVSICGDIDLSLSRFELSGNSVVVLVANAGRLEKGGTVHVISRSATVTPRN